MIERGVVVKKDKSGVEIQMQPSEACEGCNLCSRDASLFQTLHIPQKINCEPGERVDVEIDPRFALKSAFLIFFLPLVMLVLGYYLFPALVDIPGMNAVYQGIIGALLGIALTYVGVHFYDRHLQKTGKGRQARVVRVVK